MGSRPFEDVGSTLTKEMTRAQCIDPDMLLKSYEVSIGGNTRDGLFAAMPPLEAIKALRWRDPRKLFHVDISKAYLRAPVVRDNTYVELTVEMEQPGCCGRLHKALYGTRVAVRCWEQECKRMLESIGFRRGSTSPCASWHKDKGLRLVVHGDDLTSSGTENELRWQPFEQCLTKVRGIVGPESHDLRSMTGKGALFSQSAKLSSLPCIVFAVVISVRR